METQQAVQYRYTVIFEPAEEGGFIVSAPAFGGVITEGDSLEEAREMAKEAIEGLIESYLVDGKAVPHDFPSEPSDFVQENSQLQSRSKLNESRYSFSKTSTGDYSLVKSRVYRESHQRESLHYETP